MRDYGWRRPACKYRVAEYFQRPSHDIVVRASLIDDPAAVREIYERMCAGEPDAQARYLAVWKWIRSTLALGGLETLFPKWQILVELADSESLAMDHYRFDREVRNAGRWTTESINRVWPKNFRHDVRMRVIATVSGVQEKPDRFGDSTPTLRAERLKIAKKELREWTSPLVYKNTQNWLRLGRQTVDAERRALAMQDYFRSPVYRAPRTAVPGVKALYRGLHAAFAESFQKYGVVDDRGFVAFSWKREVAERFARTRPSALLRLAVQDIPAYTPWVWFDTWNQPRSQAHTECEVLLPPGRLRVGTSDKEFMEEDVLPVTYEAFAPFAPA